jgi:hypothetical protein
MQTQSEITLNRSTASLFRIAAGIAATAMTAATIGILVLLPAWIDTRDAADVVTAMRRDGTLPAAVPATAANEHKRARARG